MMREKIRRSAGIGGVVWAIVAMAWPMAGWAKDDQRVNHPDQRDQRDRSITQLEPGHHAQTVANFLTGAMQATIAASGDHTEPLRVQMTTCPVQVDATPSEITPPTIALYQEQAIDSSLDQPYRQRVLFLSELGGIVESFGFRLVDEQHWAGLCGQPIAQRAIKTTDLGEVTCVLRLVPHGEGYWGSTPALGCPSRYRGASYVTNTVRLTETTMETQDRGFDAAGNQVWGANEASYQFVDLPSDQKEL